MKLAIEFSELEDAVRRMGAKPVDFSVAVELPSLDPIDPKLEQGVELPDLKDVETSKGLLSYKGRQVLLYIRDHGGRVQQTLVDGRKGNRFHVADCKTLQGMRSAGRFERYVVTNRLDGWFEIEGRNWQTGQQEKGEAKLWVCQNCLKKLNYKGAAYGGAFEQARDFDIGEFFSTYSSFFPYLPRRRADGRDGEGYSDDWPLIAGQYKAEKNFRCEQCGVDLTLHKQLLHVHHLNGVKSDNRPDNLRALCVCCHRRQPQHGHMFVRHEDIRTINRLRREQGLLVEDSWEEAFKYCDPALHGVLDSVQRAGCPMPEIGFDVQDASGEVVGSLEIAWPRQKVGFAISDEDAKATSGVGWQIADIEATLENPRDFCRQLRSRRQGR